MKNWRLVQHILGVESGGSTWKLECIAMLVVVLFIYQSETYKTRSTPLPPPPPPNNGHCRVYPFILGMLNIPWNFVKLVILCLASFCGENCVFLMKENCHVLQPPHGIWKGVLQGIKICSFSLVYFLPVFSLEWIFSFLRPKNLGNFWIYVFFLV